jgi:hypothetical protein
VSASTHSPHQKKGRTLGRKDYLRRTDVKQSPTAKLLGVVFDQGLRWKEHVQQAIKLATKTSIALNGLRHLRPEQMRQLYQACVTPVVGYASTIWHDPLRDKTHLRHLHTVQRTALVRILSAIRTVATTALEMEVHVLPTHLRLRRRAQRTIVRLHTLPRDHTIWGALSRAQKRRNNIGSCARLPLGEALKSIMLTGSTSSKRPVVGPRRGTRGHLLRGEHGFQVSPSTPDSRKQ